jgi:sugar/nucleoside kinase (ribokinase family)
MNIVCIGDCGVDRYLPSGPVLCGGITANFALQARTVFPENDTITIITATGNDAAAAIIRNRLQDSAIDCRFTSVDGASSVQYIETEADGEKKFVRYEEGVLRDFEPGEEDKEIIATSGLRVMPVFRQIYGFFGRIMSIGSAGLTAVDFADFSQHPEFSVLDRYLDDIDIAFFGLSASDAHLIGEIESRAETHDKLLVVTLGADGCIAFRGRESFSCAAIPVAEVVDTTGAGDAFAAGFLSQYCYGETISASLNKGASVAAGIIQRMGAN